MKSDIEILKDIFEDYNIDYSECSVRSDFLIKLMKQKKVNWGYIAQTFELSDHLLEELSVYTSYIDFILYLETFKVSETFLNKNWGSIYFYDSKVFNVLKTQKLSDKFLLDKFNPQTCRNNEIHIVLLYQNVTEQTFKLYYNVLKSNNYADLPSLWKILIQNNKVSKDIINLYWNDIPEKVWGKVYEN